LARYVEERRRGHGVERSLATGVWGASPGTLIASFGAAVSYAALILTKFRGFRQFGVIGAIGMVLCWVTTFLFAPHLISVADHDGPPKRIHQPTITALLASLVTRHARAIAMVAAGLAIFSFLKVRTFDRSWIEYDFSQLRRRDSYVSGERYWGPKMDALLGRGLSPLYFLTDSGDQTIRLEQAVRAAADDPPLRGHIAQVESIEDVVPSDQRAKISEVEAIRRDLTPRILAALTGEQRSLVDKFLGDRALEPVRFEDLPSGMTANLRERTGQYDRVTLIYPERTWRVDEVIAMIGKLRKIARQYPGPDGRSPRLAGSFAISADIVSSLERDAPISTLAALVGVTLVVALTFRFREARTTSLIVGSLLLGVLYQLAATMTLGMKINVFNVVAFPITFGIAVDYASNMMARYHQEEAADIGQAIEATGGAVALCSMTTIIGYGSLLVAKSRGLFSFGLVAVLGEICCLTTAIVVLPAVLVMLKGRARC
jgi:predicted exporter